MWDQVVTDRHATEAAEAPPDNAIPETTKKLLAEIDALKALVSTQGTEIKTVGQQVSKVNGLFGNMKQQVQRIVPTVAHVEQERAAAEEAKKAEAAKKRAELRERIADFPDVLEYLDTVVPPPDDKPVMQKQASEEEPDLRQQLEIAELRRQLSDEVPGWMRIRDSNEFKTWLAAQPENIRLIPSTSLDVQQSASVFKMFQEQQKKSSDISKIESERQARLNRGQGIQGRGTTAAGVDDGGDGWD
jgi:hypothetical protein